MPDPTPAALDSTRTALAMVAAGVDELPAPADETPLERDSRLRVERCVAVIGEVGTRQRACIERCAWDDYDFLGRVTAELVWSRMSLEKDLRLDRQIGDELRHLRSGSVEASETKHGALLAVRDELARAWAPWLGEACALERANAKFKHRFEQVEALAEERGIQIGRASLEELDKLWEEVKTRTG